MGFIIPAVRLRDNLELQPNEYRFVFRGQLIATGEVMPGYSLAMNTNNSTEVLPGVQTTEPVFGLPATWITDVERKNAEVSGYTVVDPASVLVTHFSETIKRHCHQILSRQDVQVLLDMGRKEVARRKIQNQEFTSAVGKKRAERMRVRYSL